MTPENPEHEDEVPQLTGGDQGGNDEDFLICSFTQDGKVTIPRDEN